MSNLPNILEKEKKDLHPQHPQFVKKIYRQSNFAPAFFFLSSDRREALRVLYAVCRVLDDAVDAAQDSPIPFLEAWNNVFIEEKANHVRAWGQESLAKDFLKVAHKFQIPLFPMVDLIDRGVKRDLVSSRFQTPLDTENYCYGVAGTVGIACLPIFGVPVEEAKDFAVRLGIAVQWINLIRDVGLDAKMGRIYLPLDHLEQFGYTEHDLLKSRKTAEFTALMTHEAKVAKSHFKRAFELMPIKWKKRLLPARIMGQIYMALLEKIEKNQFPVFSRKIRLNLWEKTWTTLKEIKK